MGVPDLNAPLPVDLLTAQAVFALLAIYRIGEQNVAFADGKSSIWPFCYT